MSLPDDRRYTDLHEWARVEADGSVTVGITDHGQSLMGDLVFVQAPAVGSRWAAGAVCGLLESVKAAADLHCPVAGEVIAVNAELESAPERLNVDAHGTWIFRLRPDDPAGIAALLDAAAYAPLAG
ncbi:MAG: glycine cleavage system protein H [Burkholderiales bacterium]|nr:glycine cleavage system protein H [Burkholderiales bacterium]